MNITAIVLAAGGSSRLGEPKQLLRDARGETLVHRAAREARDAGVDNVFVVVGSSARDVRAAVASLDVTIIENDAWQSGLASSIVCGARAASARAHDSVDAQRHARGPAVPALLYLTCDMPTVGAEHLRALMAASVNGTQRVASDYGATRGIPAVFPPSDVAALVALTGDRGAKALLMQPDTILVALDGGTFDLDTPEDVARWRAAAPGAVK